MIHEEGPEGPVILNATIIFCNNADVEKAIRDNNGFELKGKPLSVIKYTDLPGAPRAPAAAAATIWTVCTCCTQTALS